MATKFEEAPEVKRIAEELIPQHHEHLQRYDVRLEYVFSDKAIVKAGQVTLGTARKISSLAAYLAGDPDLNETAPFFVITIWREGWDELNEAKREALVDHELMHCACEEDADGNLRIYVRPHDLEEFNDIVRRHGLWKPDVEAMARAMATAEQPELPFDDGFENSPVSFSVNGGPEVTVTGRQSEASR